MLYGPRTVASVPFVSDEQGRPIGHDSAPALQAVLRALRPILGDGALTGTVAQSPLERLAMHADVPSVSACEPLEAPGSRTIAVAESPGITAFLDGIQQSLVVAHVAGAPIVFGTVAAAVRRRHARRLETWRDPVVRRTLYASRAHLGEDRWAEVARSGLPLVDVHERVARELVSPHPLALRARALDHVALAREQAERQLAAEWCATERDWLWVDGGIAGNLSINEHATAFGVVKSHNTLYGDATSIRDTLALRAGERSAVFLVGHRPRRAVASWYLRLRDSGNADPLHGLVRVEVAPPPMVRDTAAEPDRVSLPATFAARIDAISSWILAEGAPVSLPDPRWDTLTYGVYACEQFLKSIIGS